MSRGWFVRVGVLGVCKLDTGSTGDAVDVSEAGS